MFLGDLIHRTFGELATIAPRRATRFEPAVDQDDIATMDALPDRQPPRPAAIPAVPMAAKNEKPAEPIETRVIDPPPTPAPQPHESLKVITIEKAAAPVVAPTVPPLQLVSEPLRERRETLRAARESLPSQPVLPVGHEISRETVIRERVETRVESRTIERRLESLVREPRVERIELTHMPGTPVIAPPMPVAHAAPAVTPQRTALIPETKQIARPKAKSAPKETAEPATPTVVHVTIGRVEVRATPPAPARQIPRSREPKLRLEDYLQRRERA